MRKDIIHFCTEPAKHNHDRIKKLMCSKALWGIRCCPQIEHPSCVGSRFLGDLLAWIPTELPGRKDTSHSTMGKLFRLYKFLINNPQEGKKRQEGSTCFCYILFKIRSDSYQIHTLFLNSSQKPDLKFLYVSLYKDPMTLKKKCFTLI